MPSSTKQISISIQKLFLVAFLTFFFGAAQGQNSYIRKYKSIATKLSTEYGIPTSVILGIAIVESSGGAGKNSKLLNNHFGMVGKNNLHKTKGIRTRYKQYPNAEASFKDFCRMVSDKKYYHRLKGNTHYLLWLDAISKAGYSEAPAVWKKRVAGVIRKNKLA